MTRIVAFTVLLTLALPALAGGGDYGGGTGLYSSYVFRGRELADAGLASDLFVDAGLTPGVGLSAAVWNYTKVGGIASVETDYDLSAAFRYPLPSLNTVGIVIGTIYYDRRGADSHEIYVGVAPELPFSPALYFYHDLKTGSGLHARLSAERVLRFASGRLGLQLAPQIGVNFGGNTDLFNDAVLRTSLFWKHGSLLAGPSLDLWLRSSETDPNDRRVFKPAASFSLSFARSF